MKYKMLMLSWVFFQHAFLIHQDLRFGSGKSRYGEALAQQSVPRPKRAEGNRCKQTFFGAGKSC